VSHQPERKDKTCLNCGAAVQGRFCHVCGQENIVPHQNFWSLTKHFVFDIFHFDGKFFDTLKYLLFRPGYVAKEYVKGRRMSYLDPVRMYLFTSALFFLLFFKFVHPTSAPITLNNGKKEISNRKRIHIIDSLQSSLSNTQADSVRRARLEYLKDTTRQLTLADLDLFEHNTFNIGNKKFDSVSEYEHYQQTLPVEKRDGLLKRSVIKKSIKVNKKYEGNMGELLKEFFEAFLHRLPILLFFSLPFFALILKLLYARMRTFFYSDHAVFTLYQYIFSFMLILFFFGLSALQNWTDWILFGWLIFFGFIYGGYYLLHAMKYFYGQSWGKTTVKFILLNMLGGITLLLLFIIFFLLSIFEL
jgi:hypothetical protein